MAELKVAIETPKMPPDIVVLAMMLFLGAPATAEILGRRVKVRAVEP